MQLSNCSSEQDLWLGVGSFAYNALHVQCVLVDAQRFEQRIYYFGSFRVKLTLTCQTQTLPPSMHFKWDLIIGFVCKTTNGKIKLLMKVLKLKNNSNVRSFHPSGK